MQQGHFTQWPEQAATGYSLALYVCYTIFGINSIAIYGML